MNLQTLANLTALYTQPHRYYHNLDHINKCLGEFQEFQANATGKDVVGSPHLVEEAIWWHDAVYNPYSKTNEKDSANLFYHSLDPKERHWSYNSVIQRSILATGQHEYDQEWINDPELENISKVVLDLDLSSLGSSEEEFEINGENIRLEYGHIPDATFFAARLSFLNKLLGRERLFYTDYFFNKYEKSARSNISMEVNTISYLHHK